MLYQRRVLSQWDTPGLLKEILKKMTFASNLQLYVR